MSVSGRLGLASLLAAMAYGALGWATLGNRDGAAVEMLLGAQAIGWLALAAAWMLRNEELDTRVGVTWILAGAVVFRLAGLAATPGWEDDYFRHLWDGWMSWHTGSPYGVTPLQWFGEEAVPERMQAVLDAVNHPEHATIYGPVAQVWAALAAWGPAAGSFVSFKLGLLLAEAGGAWALWRLGGVRALLFVAWCPLAVTEIAFAGHVDALVMAGVAGALLAAGRGRTIWACVWLGLAVATKAYALMLAPFFIWRAGWRGAAAFAAVLVTAYAPWIATTVAAGRPMAAVWGGSGVGAMAGGFEFNSSGYAVLASLFGERAGRLAAAGVMLGGWAFLWLRWQRGLAKVSAVAASGPTGRGEHPSGVTKLVTQSDRERVAGGHELESRTVPAGRSGAIRKSGMAGVLWLPGAAMVGWWALWSPVFHPWYALLALPFLGLRPSGWGVGLLAALPLSYVHGLTLGAGATGDFRHPIWVRPAELAGVALGALVGKWRAIRLGDRERER